eukprot:16054413-Heterocapsa_arctica.AAC.1
MRVRLVTASAQGAYESHAVRVHAPWLVQELLVVVLDVVHASIEAALDGHGANERLHRWHLPACA